MRGLYRVFYTPMVYLLCLSVFLSGMVQAYSVRSITPPSNGTFLRNVAIYTPGQRISATAPFNLTFTLEEEGDRTIKFALEPNHDLLIQDPHINFLGDGGQERGEVIRRDSHKVFRGAVFVQSVAYRWEKVGWARISVLCDGLSPLFMGAFSVKGTQYDIKLRPSTSDQSQKEMLAHRTSPDDGFDSINPALSTLATLQSRQWTPTLDASDFVDTIGDNSGCPSEREIALVGIATDCTYTASFDSSEELISSLIDMVNTASQVFETSFNIALAFHNLSISESSCPSSASASEPWNTPCGSGDLNSRLNAFSSWRSTIGNDDNAYWTLMTGCPTGSEVGVSWVGELCGEMGVNVVASAGNQWQVFAHESGHTFGAYHDCESTLCSLSGSSRQCCPLSSSTCSADAEYIMNPVSTSPQTEFSPCTIGNVCSAIGRGRVQARCLTTRTDIPTVSTGECGNGIVEVGEECDCGEDCDDNPCCDGSTCRFIGDAVCDSASGDGDGDGSCCRDCQFLSRGTVCRAARSECDIEEACPGDSGDCPEDETEDNGSSCGSSDSDLFCASGQCTSRDIQCQAQISGDNATISSCSNSTESCMLSCSSPSSNSCSNSGTVLDGTPCSDGLCSSGVCRRSNRNNPRNGASWFDRNRALVIGLAAGLGSLLVIVILACLVSRCYRRRRPKSMRPIPVPRGAGPVQAPRAGVLVRGSRGVPPGPTAQVAGVYMPPPAYSPRAGGGQPMPPTSFRYA
ncbi:Metallo-peptidase family M12-domain-containing protein [Aspergillus multicolor]|uniref:ADAM family of metalloprotease ADM-A n=1 Tax=Aspergillus multicolor TaxID=41759 RepID=UPI003CCDE116